MNVTAKEEREIISECQEPPVVESPSSEAAAPAEEPVRPEPDIASIVNACLDEKLAPLTTLTEGVQASRETLSAVEKSMAKLGDLYDLMTQNRNRAMLLLTKHIEMYERLKALAAFCREHIVADETTPPFEKSLLTRTGNIERIAQRTLGSFGVLPIWPERNDAFDENLHQIISETDPLQADDVPGAIAECLKMGVMRDGVVAKAAEVVVFKTHVTEQEKKEEV